MKLSFKRLIVFASVIAIMILALVNLGQFGKFILLIKELNLYILSLMVVVQAVSYYGIASYYQSVLEIYGYKMPLKKLYELSLTVNFINQILPSGGVSGTSFLSHELADEVPVGKTTLMQVLLYVFTYLSFMLVLIFGFLLLFFSGSINKITVRFILFLIILILIVSTILLSLIRDRPRIEKVMRNIVKLINKIILTVTKKRSRIIEDKGLSKFFDEFYQGYDMLLTNPKPWQRPILFTLLGNFAEVATVYVVFLAFGHIVNFGAVIVAYLIANIFSLLSVFAGGIGFYEASMVAAFVALGIPLSLSISAVLVYRVVSFWAFFAGRGLRIQEETMEEQLIGVGELITLINETLTFAYPQVKVEGEISGFQVRQDKWVHFDLKDDEAKVSCFMTTYQLKMPIEDGMKVKVTAQPRLTKWGAFSLTVRLIEPSGEGALRRAFELLRQKLDTEGLFNPERKRPLPKYPVRIGLITSSSSAAYGDFIKIVSQRWAGLKIHLADVVVQGNSAPTQIASAIHYFNQLATPVDVLVIIRGGGSLEDLAAFSQEDVVRGNRC